MPSVKIGGQRGGKRENKTLTCPFSQKKKKKLNSFFPLHRFEKIETFLRFGSHEWPPLPFRNSAVNPCGKYARLMREPKWNDIRREMQFFWSLDIKTKGAKPKKYIKCSSLFKTCVHSARHLKDKKKGRRYYIPTCFFGCVKYIHNKRTQELNNIFLCVWPWNAICWEETKRRKKKKKGPLEKLRLFN